MIRITFETKSINCIEALSRCYADFHASATQPPAQTLASEVVTPEQLNDAMVQATMKLNDGGAACIGLLNSCGVKTISELPPEKLLKVLEKVRDL